MSQSEYDAAIARFLAKNAVTRCPTACVIPTRTALAEDDKMALRNYVAAREAARLEKLRNLPRHLAI